MIKASGEKMKQLLTGLFGMGLIISVLASGNIPVKTKVDSIGLFKNGLAVVRRSLRVTETGTYVVDDVPEPVHGTFWIESDTRVVTRLTSREFEIVAGKSQRSLEETFAGQEVTVHLGGEKTVSLQGTMIKEPSPEDKRKWNQNYQQQYWHWYGYRSQADFNRQQNQYRNNSRFLTLKTTNGIIYLDSSRIEFIEANGINDNVKRKKPVLLFEVDKVPEKQGIIVISYLTKGISWAPSYRIMLDSPEKLTIAQKAVIKNEFGDFKNAEIQLISGFPNVKFAHVTSPLSLQTSWSSFFQQLNQRFRPGHASLSNAISQQAVQFNRPDPSRSGLNVAGAGGDGVDIHYQNIGDLSMADGDSLAMTVDKKTAEYQRIVEWIVPDTRNEKGRYINQYQRRNDPDKYRDAAWDSIRFRNPFKFPMTTAAAIICESKRFLGETLSYWVNPGDETVLHITKALSVKTRASEQEIKGKREIVYIAGDDYQKTAVKGKLFIKNYRSSPIKLIIRRRFSGELISADDKPKCELREEGAYSVNERNELTWELDLAPEAEKTLTYRYTVLVDR